MLPNVINFKRDLDDYSENEIKTIGKMYDLTGDVKDLRWLIAIKHSQKAQMLSGGIMSFSEKLPQLQKVAKERNDTSFPVIDSSFIDNLLQLARDQRQFKKDLRKMTREDKQATENGLTERENYLKKQSGWTQIQELREQFNVQQQSFDWVIKSYLSGSINNVEDISSRLKPAIDDFEWLKKNNKIDRKIKLQQLNGLKGLEDFLDQHEEDLQEKRGELADVEKRRQGGELIYDGKDIKIIKPTTKEGACYYGKGTRWCTAATQSMNMFETYNTQGPLYIIQSKNPGRDGREKYQLHFVTKSFMDEKDEPVELAELYEKYPEIIVLRKYTPKLLISLIKGDDLETLLRLTKDNPVTDAEANLFFDNETVRENIFNHLVNEVDLQNIKISNREILEWFERKDMLDRVTQLYLVYIKTSELTNILHKLGNLQILDLSGNQMSELPDSVGNLSNLRELDLHFNNIRELPDSIGSLKNLKVFNLSSNRIRELPDSIGGLKNLQDLDLSYNQIGELPESIGGLKNLQDLNLSSNRIRELPESIGSLKGLQTLDLSFNNLNTLPPTIGELKSLQTLNLSNNQINVLPDSLHKLSNLGELYLHNNQISKLPDSIGNLSNLQILNLGSNEISELPPTIGGLKSLQTLDLSFNKLNKLPPTIGELKKLEDFNPSYNQLSKLPPIIGELRNLRKLNVQGNKLETLPTSLKKLDLESLNVQDNIMPYGKNIDDMLLSKLKENLLALGLSIDGPKYELQQRLKDYWNKNILNHEIFLI